MHTKQALPRYGLALALGAFALQWLEHQYAQHLYSTEVYIVVLAAIFTGVGIWIGHKITVHPSIGEFSKNQQIIQTLAITPREEQVLQLLAAGHSNAEIAELMFISTSTVKTHLIHLYQKLDVSRRTQAVQQAKTLGIIE